MMWLRENCNKYNVGTLVRESLVGDSANSPEIKLGFRKLVEVEIIATQGTNPIIPP